MSAFKGGFMKKIMYYICIVTVSIFFALIMNSGDYFKKSMSADFTTLSQALNAADWNKAEDSMMELRNSWEETVPRIQFSVEKDEINAIDVNISRMEAYIHLREKNAAYVELNEALEHWNNLNK